jgi:thioester reductase-like protein
LVSRRKHTAGYHLLTGATGLLGSYLLRDGLLAGRRFVVLVRPSKSESARQRVESLVRQWELALEAVLPRPVVLEGDLGEIDLGLDNSTLRWIARHCVSVIHNAASLVFRGDDPEGEPYLSNVEGTRRMLELCRCTGIRQFHHVSTAYVCGLREGRILESEVDVGQTSGNVYEKTKLQAEQMVRSADFLDPPTIYRPSIIVGDSQTGYTTTYHGFYAPLKLAHTMVGKVARGATAGDLLVEALGIRPVDRKNFVPVDWVSAVISHIHGHPESHGTTYHVTSPHPPRIVDMASVMQEVVEELSPLADPDTDWTLDGEWFARTFREQLGIYGAYWRDDPQFDVTNTLRAAPHLPCPPVDRDMMTQLARFAIGANFGRTRRTKYKPEFDVHGHLRRLVRNRSEVMEDDPGAARVGVQVDGPGGGQWELVVRDGRLVTLEDGVSARSEAVFHVNSATFRTLAHGEMTVADAFRFGHVRILGHAADVRRVAAVLQLLAGPALAESAAT